MMLAIDQRVSTALQAEEGKLRMLSDELQKLLEGLAAMRVAQEIQDERRGKELKMLESNLALDLSAAREARQDAEGRAEQLCEQQIMELREEGIRGRLFQRHGLRESE